MKHSSCIRILAAFFLLWACMTPSIPAFIVSSVNVTPAGYQPAGTPVTVVSVMNFPATGATTFAPDGDLRMSTDLVDAEWIPVVIVDGRETSRETAGGGELILPGKDLSFLPSQSVQLSVTVSGTMPSDRHPGQTILTVQERDAAKKIVTDNRVAMPEVTLAPVTSPSATATGPVTAKTPASLPADTTQSSPAGTGIAILALAGAALLVWQWK